MDTNDRWEVENILFHMTHQWLYGQSTCESMLLFVSSPCSIKRISIPLKRERQPDTFAFTAYYRKSCHHCDFTFMSPCARACACRCDGHTSSPPLRQEWNAQAGKLHLTWRQKPLPHYNMTKKKRKKKKKKGAEVSISALNITVMGCLTPTLCQWALHYGSFEAICTALGFDAAGTHIHVHVLNGSGRCITNWGKFVRMQNIAVILLLQNPGWMENTGITQAWRINDTPHPWSYFHQCVLSIYDLPLAPERSAFMSCLFIPRRNKLQETLGSKWEVQSYPVKAIKSREARLSPHKLPEMRSAGKYAEPRRQGLVCVLCVNST